MKQVIQNGRGSKLRVRDVPAPGVQANSLLVQTSASLISAGTERQMVGFARSGLLAKARSRPDLVKKVLTKAKRDGAIATLKSVTARLDEPLPLGYSAAGRVVEVGRGLEGRFEIGELVAISGAGLANHAEFNVVPQNLVAPIPTDVSAEQACFSTLGSIALHSVRLLGPQLGDFVAIIGAGLVGLLAAQFARLFGARVAILDYDSARLELGRRNGAEIAVRLGHGDYIESIMEATRGLGCDGVLIAAATASSEPFNAAATIARDRAKICLVGITGTQFPYREFMQKELNIIVSRSYGPGRYDRDFENRHMKYPAGYVRWTETENLREVARLMSPSISPRLNIESLITHRFPFDRAQDAYDLILNRNEPHLGVVLHYDTNGRAESASRLIRINTKKALTSAPQCVVGGIGAGNFGKTTILPALSGDSRVRLDTLVTQRGVSAEGTGSKFGFIHVSSNIDDVLSNRDITAVVITTPHSSHANLVSRSLNANKSVFVEKPLALSRSELLSITNARESSAGFFTVGFNRRFAPYVIEAKKFLKSQAGRSLIFIRVNAGQLASESWQRDAEEGQGRILGELCHFIDLAIDLAESSLLSVSAQAASASRGLCEDLTVTLRFEDGSLATIIYTALGDTSFSKELIECYKSGTVCRIDNFRELVIVANGKELLKKKSMVQDKGHSAQIKSFVDGVLIGRPPIDEQSLVDSSLATILVLESLQSGRAVSFRGSDEGENTGR